MIDNGFSKFLANPKLQSHIGFEALTQLALNPNRLVVIDTQGERREFKASLLLALGLRLAAQFKTQFSQKRVGVVLPPGIGAFLANLGLFLADKVPVNLNFTAPRASLIAGMHKAEVVSIITAQAMQDKLSGFPWTPQVVDIKQCIHRLSRLKTVATLVAIRVLPLSWLASLYNTPRQGGDNEAALLFTSGSDGDIKGVPLTHSNLIANVLQVAACGVLPEQERLLACLPIFHSFGFTVTLVYPLLQPITVITTPSPLEVKKIAELIEQEQVTVHLGTPTFFRPYLKGARPEQLKTLRVVVAGAEKTPPGLHEAWERSFDSAYLEGYGLTETTPVVSVNLPNTPQGEVRRKAGSVGRLFMGMAARIVCPDTLAILPIGAVGLLELKGANVFNGYLNDPVRTAAAFHDGWFRTHDLARLDEAGFLYIEGRLARFSKMGGEMVSHGAIEAALARAYNVPEGEHPWVVVGLPDADKGERLVLVSTRSITPEALRHTLVAEGLPNLWIPRQVVVVPSLPVLASGKLDLKACRELCLV